MNEPHKAMLAGMSVEDKLALFKQLQQEQSTFFPPILTLGDNIGFVRLVEWQGGDLSIVRSARTSYDAAWRAGENDKSDSKLINFLMQHRHMTPFEAVELTFEVKAPILIFRQWHRHRTQSYNEQSARYCELSDEFYYPAASTIGVQSVKNKQGRNTADNTDDFVKEREGELELMKDACKHSYRIYKELIQYQWPRELARSVLPVNIYSHMFTKMNLRNLLQFLDLRDDSHAQWEIQQYAKAMKVLARRIAPVAMQAWETLKFGD